MQQLNAHLSICPTVSPKWQVIENGGKKRGVKLAMTTQGKLIILLLLDLVQVPVSFFPYSCLH
jgi:hypothetical protein